MLLPTDPKDSAQSAAVKKFFDWGFGNGDEIATNLLYVPLPDSGARLRSARRGEDVPGAM